jgi:hypothetical protein
MIMSEKDYDLFELKIEADNAIIITWTPQKGLEHHYKARLDADIQLLQKINTSIFKLEKGELKGRDEIQSLGGCLYEAIFPGKVGRLFEQALETVLYERRHGQENRWLRMIIDVEPQSPVFHWPLEFLYCPNKEQWLATARPFIALSRRTIFDEDVVVVDLERAEPPLNVLVVISNPKDLGGVLSGKVLEEIATWVTADSIVQGDHEPQMTVKVLGLVPDFEQVSISGIDYLNQPATWENLHELIASPPWHPHVFHFIGHGQYDQKHEVNKLALVDEEGQPVWCDAHDISQLFSSWLPHLVLLQACEGAASGTEPGFMSLADQLVHRNILAVVAMQFVIENNYATLFARSFYDAIRQGKDIDEAVQIGRMKICNKVLWKDCSFGAPVLFTYTPEGIIAPRIINRRKIPVGTIAEKEADPAKRSIEHLRIALRSLGEEIDVTYALSRMESAQNLLRDINPSVAKIINDAYEDLTKFGDVQSAKSSLLYVQGRLTKAKRKNQPILLIDEEKAKDCPESQENAADIALN